MNLHVNEAFNGVFCWCLFGQDRCGEDVSKLCGYLLVEQLFSNHDDYMAHFLTCCKPYSQFYRHKKYASIYRNSQILNDRNMMEKSIVGFFFNYKGWNNGSNWVKRNSRR